jgi:uncharacterized delta-60 repeat protein
MTTARVMAGLLVLAAVAGCDDDPIPAMDMAAAADLSAAPDLTMQGGSDAGVMTMSKITPLSATGNDKLYGVLVDPQGSVYASGVIADNTTGPFKMLLAKYTLDGTLDTTFAGTGFVSPPGLTITGSTGNGFKVARQSDGKIIIAGAVDHPNDLDPMKRDRDIAVVRYNTNGTIDMTFGDTLPSPNGITMIDLSLGYVGMTFTAADTVWGVAVDSMDRIVLNAAQLRAASADLDAAIIRLTPNGARDMSFGTNGVVTKDIDNRSHTPKGMVVLPDNSIVSGGYYTDGAMGAQVRPSLIKITSGGTVDNGFGLGGVYNQPALAAVTEVYNLVAQGTSLVTAGYGRPGAGTVDVVSLRITGAGALDPTYGASGLVHIDYAGFNDRTRSLAVLPNGGLILVGAASPDAANVDAMILMLTADGQRDTSFTASGLHLYDFGGASDMLWDVAVAPSNKRVVVVGEKAGVAGGNDDAALILVDLP